MVKKYIPKYIRIQKIITWLNRHINFLMGSLSGIITGTIVFFINYEHGFEPALYSFFKQFFFNLLIGGFNIRVCEKITLLIQHKNTAIIFASIIPSVQAFIILYSIHYFGNTPKPEASTYWQFGANIIVFFFMALFYRDSIKIKGRLKLSLQKLIQRLRLTN